MATSPNFLWPEPDNTDLVKNGALAIRTAVDAIDSSMADLKGGTTGQVLSKTSNTDMDFTWVAPTTGDITEVVAGTGLTGGGTSGAVTLALNSSSVISPTIIDAAGDLIIGTAADTAGRLAIGTNGQVLTSNGTTATWSTPAGGGGAVVQVKNYNTTTTTSSTSATYVDTNLTISVTPTSSSNKILVIASGYLEGGSGGSAYDTGVFANIVRGSTQICETNSYFYKSNEATGYALGVPMTMNYTDSPATTSSTTYKIQIKKGGGTNIYFKPISITVMEVTP